MQCSSCRYPDSRVVYTRHDDNRNLTLRRHECLRCGRRFFTHEKIREATRPHDGHISQGTAK